MCSSCLVFSKSSWEAGGVKGRHHWWGSWGRNLSQGARPGLLLWNGNIVKGNDPLLELLVSKVVIHSDCYTVRIICLWKKNVVPRGSSTLAIKFQLKSWQRSAGLNPDRATFPALHRNLQSHRKSHPNRGRTSGLFEKDWEPGESRTPKTVDLGEFFCLNQWGRSLHMSGQV